MKNERLQFSVSSAAPQPRLGIKPLYVSERPDRLRFASTLPALLAAGDVDTTIDAAALHHYMSLHEKGHSKLWQIALLECWLQTHGI